MDSELAGVKWQHSTAKGKMGVVTIIDSRIKAATGIVWLP